MNKLNNKVAIVTGAARGMGFGVSKKMAEYGAIVNMISRGDNVMDSAQAIRDNGYSAEGYKCDVRDHEALEIIVKKIVEKYGRVDILVNVAGIAPLKAFTAPDIKQNLDDIMGINFGGTWNMCHIVIPYMLQNGYGKIVNFSSVTGVMVCDPEYSSYAISKAAIAGLTKGLAAEYAARNINVNAILPGTVYTPMMDSIALDTIPNNPQKVLDDMANAIPMKRLGTIEEAGEVVSFLVSDESSYITGSNMSTPTSF